MFRDDRCLIEAVAAAKAKENSSPAVADAERRLSGANETWETSRLPIASPSAWREPRATIERASEVNACRERSSGLTTDWTDETDPGIPNLSGKSVVKSRHRARRAAEASQDSSHDPVRRARRTRRKTASGARAAERE